jgi:hypothetical protein
MLARLRSHLMGNAVAYVALFVALGGTSYAVARLPANSVGAAQITRNAVGSQEVRNFSLLAKDFKRGSLPRGARGATGPQGDPGSQGQPGPKGNDGARGPSDIFGNSFAGVDVQTSATGPFSLADIDVPAGSYVVSANAYVTNGESSEQSLTCGLGAPGLTSNGNLDFAVDAVKLDVGPSGGPNTDLLVMSGVAILPAADNLSFDCRRSGTSSGGQISFDDIQIGALQVGAVHVP